MLPTMHERILILDYGSQVTQLIARRLRDTGVDCEIHPGDVERDFIRSQRGVEGVILFGSPVSAYQADSLNVPTEVFELGVPVLSTEDERVGHELCRSCSHW